MACGCVQVSAEGTILGVVTEGNLTAKLSSGRVSPSDPVTKALYSQFRCVSLTTKLGDLARIFDRDHFALVVTTQRCIGGNGSVTDKTVISGIVSRCVLHCKIACGCGCLLMCMSLCVYVRAQD